MSILNLHESGLELLVLNVLLGNKWEVVMNLKPNLKFGGQAVLLVLTI